MDQAHGRAVATQTECKRMSIRVNCFEITVSAPYPCWINVRRVEDDGTTLRSLGDFSHRELRDLQYAVERAIHEVEGLLPAQDKHEIA